MTVGGSEGFVGIILSFFVTSTTSFVLLSKKISFIGVYIGKTVDTIFVSGCFLVFTKIVFKYRSSNSLSYLPSASGKLGSNLISVFTSSAVVIGLPKESSLSLFL